MFALGRLLALARSLIYNDTTIAGARLKVLVAWNCFQSVYRIVFPISIFAKNPFAQKVITVGPTTIHKAARYRATRVDAQYHVTRAGAQYHVTRAGAVIINAGNAASQHHRDMPPMRLLRSRR